MVDITEASVVLVWQMKELELVPVKTSKRGQCTKETLEFLLL